MNNTFTTNVLLLVCAVLLLTLVVQNSMGPNRQSEVGPRVTSSMPPSNSAAARNPSVRDGVTSMGHHSMFFQALSGFAEGCDGARTLAECSSPAAEVVKADIMNFTETGAGPREVFDYIVEKYGMEALTAEAQQIRRARTGQ